ncbi:hypothetical protein WR25_05248 [Diploscapter pachys]|uniref:U2A'/phosphoprotein 32 family A C-terminal domain-containing protein n=1 Tax=Diploscapter pachys TaxID=2018661 RepID=A0A2A2K2B2_9BILA|nr:hypothetical protein WR25_05248 [Diploscapter pachys]
MLGIYIQILDLNQNRVESVKDIHHLQNLTDFWAKGNKASRFSTILLTDWSVFDELERLPRLSFVYLDDNPFSTNNETYRAKAIRLLPQVYRLDAQFVKDESVGVRPWKTDKQDEQ